MNPNATLDRLRLIVDELSRRDQGLEPVDRLELADEMAELFRALDGELSKGGVLPVSWLPF